MVGAGGISNGLYSIHIRMLDGIDAGNTGVMLLHDGRIRGGDAFFDYIGAYTAANGKWKGELVNREHTQAKGDRPLFSAERVVGARTQSDQTVQVPKGTRVEVDDCSGDTIVRTWDRDAVRVQARHTSRTRVRANLVGNQLRIDIDADRGPGSADLELSVPAWINLRIDGNNCFVEVAGVSGAVSVKTVEGDIVLTGLSGTVDAESVEGKITLEGGRGRVQLSTVEGDIAISKAGGEIVAESVDGEITLTETQASAVEISTVDGDVLYSGALLATGRYLFTTHDGDVTMAIPENTSATFS